MKSTLKNLLRKIGYDIITFKTGFDPYYDISQKINKTNPLIIDVGANQGQTILKMKKLFRACTIHAFEPSPSTFKTLTKSTLGMRDVFLWNLGLGAECGSLLLNDNSCDDMSSFLELGDQGWGVVTGKTSVNVMSFDEFLIKQEIEFVDLLKIDTQGFEFEVLKGCSETLRSGKINLIYFEVNFTSIYKELPSFSELFDFCIQSGYELVAMYPSQIRHEKAAWTDILFQKKN